MLLSGVVDVVSTYSTRSVPSAPKIPQHPQVVQSDDDSQGENFRGYYHTITLGPRRVREAVPRLTDSWWK